jgi:streptogramin lyase
MACSDKRADGGSRVWLHEKAHEIIVSFRHNTASLSDLIICASDGAPAIMR